MIENVYTLKILNMDDKQHVYDLEVDGIKDMELLMDVESIIVGAGKVLDLPVRLRTSEENLTRRSNDINFYLTAKNDNRLYIKEKAKFLGPAP